MVEGALPDGVADLWSLLHNNGINNYWVEVIICGSMVLYILFLCSLGLSQVCSTVNNESTMMQFIRSTGVLS